MKRNGIIERTAAHGRTEQPGPRLLPPKNAAEVLGLDETRCPTCRAKVPSTTVHRAMLGSYWRGKVPLAETEAIRGT
jgi:hypothetical protein